MASLTAFMMAAVGKLSCNHTLRFSDKFQSLPSAFDLKELITAEGNVTPGGNSWTPLTIYPSKWKHGLYFLASPALMLIGGAMLRAASNHEHQIVGQLVGWFIILISSLFFFLMLCALIARVPKILVDRNGLHLIEFGRTKFWRWSEVGPFSISRLSYWPVTRISLCANTDENHDLMRQHGIKDRPSPFDADLTIDLAHFSAGRNVDLANELADTLNHWRAQFGQPEINVAQRHSKIDAERLARKKRWKSAIWIVIIVGMGTIATIFNTLIHLNQMQ